MFVGQLFRSGWRPLQLEEGQCFAQRHFSRPWGEWKLLAGGGILVGGSESVSWSGPSYNRLFLPFTLRALDFICSWTEPDGCSPSAISPDPMCVRWTKFVGSPIILRSILLLLFFGGGLATTQQPILCQKSLMPTRRLSSCWPLLSAALQAKWGTAACG